MFTPPPSPHPFGPLSFPSSSVPSQESIEKFSSSQDAKRCIGQRFRWAVILVPLIVVVVTVCAGYWTSQESLRPLPLFSWRQFGKESSWTVHKRSPEPQGQSSLSDLASQPASSTTTSAPPAGSSSQTPISDQPAPMIPSAPPTLPTPFPQPFDGSIAQNFSSSTCLNFFANMTNSAPFRSCRPFSMLFGSSTQFINAQVNLTLMNSIIWGTCNTNTPYAQCQANMGWFATTLKTACSQELKAFNTLATSTLVGLQAFSVMHDVACLADPTSNTYCYINAVRNPNPSDSYYYGLPIGTKLPKSSTPTCSACTKSIMGIYSSALEDPVQRPLLTGLTTTYEPSADLSVQLCGAVFAQTNVISAAVPTLGQPFWILSWTLATIFAWTILIS